MPDLIDQKRNKIAKPILSSQYIFQRNGVNWDKVPFVPRPSLVPDPITAFGKKKNRSEVRESILKPINREAIQADPKYLKPLEPYVSPRDQTREKVLGAIRRKDFEKGAQNMDVLLPKLHGTATINPEHRFVYYTSEPVDYARSYRKRF